MLWAEVKVMRPRPTAARRDLRETIVVSGGLLRDALTASAVCELLCYMMSLKGVQLTAHVIYDKILQDLLTRS